MSARAADQFAEQDQEILDAVRNRDLREPQTAPGIKRQAEFTAPLWAFGLLGEVTDTLAEHYLGRLDMNRSTVYRLVADHYRVDLLEGCTAALGSEGIETCDGETVVTVTLRVTNLYALFCNAIMVVSAYDLPPKRDSVIWQAIEIFAAQLSTPLLENLETKTGLDLRGEGK